MNRKLTEMLRIPESIRVPYLGGVLYRYFTKLDNKIIAESQVPAQPLNQETRDIIITASLTSFPARIHYVHLAIKSLMLQSCKPDRIILWLANEQFPDHDLPKSLTELEKYGLEIKWCDDLYGHKKYFYCIQEQKENEVVITFDDDIIYPIDAIKRLMAKHREYPDCLICERAQTLPKNNDRFYNVGRWDTISNIALKTPSYSVCPSTGGGYLIPFGAYPKHMLRKEVIMNYAPKNDDMWCMFMAAENKVRFIKTRKYHRSFSVINGTQSASLAELNVVHNAAKADFIKLKEAYPEAYNRIVFDHT